MQKSEDILWTSLQRKDHKKYHVDQVGIHCNINRYDLNKDRKKETITSCKELLDDYNKNNQDDEADKRLVDVLGQDDDAPEVEEKKEEDDPNRRQDITLDIEDDDQSDQLHQQLIQSVQQEEEQKVEFIEEGYLHKKKPKENALLAIVNIVKVVNQNLKWDHRFKL